MKKRLFVLLLSLFLLTASLDIRSYAAGLHGDIVYQIEKSKDAVFIIDDKPSVDIEVIFPENSEDKYSIRLTVDNDISETVLLYPSNGGSQSLHLEFPVTDEGYHKFSAVLLKNEEIYHNYEFEQYYIRSVDNNSYTERGFCVHYEQNKGSIEDAEMIKASGTPVIRDGISWSSVEQEKGVYDFSKSDEFIPLLLSYGIDPLLVVSSYNLGNDLYLDENGDRLMRSPEQIEAFSDFVLAAVKRYPEVRKWEILNEPNFLITGEEYFNIVYTTAKKIKEYDPTLEVYAGGLAIYDNKNFVNGFYVEQLYPYIDGISYHHYNHWRYADGPEYYTTTDEILEIMLREGGWKNLIITETGYSTGIYNEQVPEIKQASENVKRAVICDWYGIDYLAFYDFKNDGYDETEREHNFGTVTIENEPKQGYYTIKQYQKATNRAQYIGEAFLSDDITAHLYASNDDYFMIAWAKNQDPQTDIRYDNPVTAIYDFGDENVRIENMYGEYMPGHILNATYQPSYIHGLSKEFCLNAISENKNDLLFKNLKNLSAQMGYSIENIENIYKDMLISGDIGDLYDYIDACYDFAGKITNDFLYDNLDMIEAAFSNILSETERVCENGVRICALFDVCAAAPEGVYEKYDSISLSPDKAVDSDVAYINEAYYKGRSILDSLSKYDEGERVEPCSGNGFFLSSDNVISVRGISQREEVLFRIENPDGDTVYLNLIPSDGDGNYDFSYTPDFPYGDYKIYINNGTEQVSSLKYTQADDYLSIEDKMTAVGLIQADKLFSLYTSLLDWEDIKYSYTNPNTDAFVWNQTQWINITGKIERMSWTEYSDVLLAVYNKDNGDLIYLDSTFPEDDGSYRFSFKYEGDTDLLDIKINQGGVLISNENIEAAAEDMLITGTIGVEQNADIAEITLQINNYFKLAGKTYQPVMAYYDIDGRLLTCIPMNIEDIDGDENIKKYNIDIPSDAALLKVFAWESADNMKPVLETNETTFSEVR